MDKTPQKDQENHHSKASASDSFDSSPFLETRSPPAFQLQTKGQNSPEKPTENVEKQDNPTVELEYAATDGFPNEGPPSQLNSTMSSVAPPSFQLMTKASNGGLPTNLKSGVENLSGFSMDDVNVNYNSSKPAQLNAHAYAQGSNIEIGPGQEKHLPHEAWHVVQQKQGRVEPTKQLKEKVAINDNTGLEKEADVMGAKALDSITNSSDHQAIQNHKSASGNPVVQAKLFDISKIQDYDKKALSKSASFIKKINTAIEKFNEYDTGRGITTNEAKKQLRTLITISSLFERMKDSEKGMMEMRTMKIRASQISSEIKFIQSILQAFSAAGEDADNALEVEINEFHEEGNSSDDVKYGGKGSDDDMETEIRKHLDGSALETDGDHEEESGNPLETVVNHFAPSMEATVLSPIDAVSLSMTAASDKDMGAEITSVNGPNNGLGIGLSAIGQITAISTMILAAKNYISANADIKKNPDDGNVLKIANEEKLEAGLELLNGATALIKSTAGMADIIVKMNPQNLADAVLKSASQASGTVAGAAGIVWNAYQLIINAKDSDDSRKAYYELKDIPNKDIFDKAIEYSKERLRRRAIRKGVAAASGALGVVAGAVGIAIAAGVAATPAGWALAAAGLIIGLSILGYKIGKSIYKKHHRRMKAKTLILDLDSVNIQDREYAETYLSSVLGLNLAWCHELIDTNELGKLNNEIISRMENKREIIAKQIQNILSTKSEGDSDYDAAAAIMGALKIDLELAKSAKGTAKIKKELASW